MTTHNLDDVAAAYLQTHNAFQELTFLLERKGIITPQELGKIYGETPDSGPSFRAAPENERATCERCCAHSVITDEKSPLFARDSGMLADSQSVDSEVIA